MQGRNTLAVRQFGSAIPIIVAGRGCTGNSGCTKLDELIPGNNRHSTKGFIVRDGDGHAMLIKEK